MMNHGLASAGPGVWEGLLIILVCGVPVLLIVLLIRLVLRNKRENIRLRLEVGKLADEVEQARKQSRSDEEDKSSTESG
jgi:uncharacterized membrane-anchored protein YhcB (DUF1043 family)